MLESIIFSGIGIIIFFQVRNILKKMRKKELNKTFF